MDDYTTLSQFEYFAENDDYGYPLDMAQEAVDPFTKYAIVFLIVAAVIAILFVVAGNLEMGVILGGVLVAVAIFISPFVGICMLAFTLPLAGLLQIIPGLFTGSKALAVLVAVSYLPRLLFLDLRRVFKSKGLIWYIIVTLWGATTVIYSPTLVGGLISAGINLQIMGMAFLVSAIPKSFGQLRYIALSALAGAAFLGIYIALFGMSSLTAEHVSSGRLAGGQNENALAHALCVGLIMAGFVWQGRGKAIKMLVLIFSLFTFLAIGLTRSRGAWLAIFAALTGGILFSRKIPVKYKTYFVVGTAVFLILAVLLLIKGGIGGMGYEIIERFHSITEAKSSGGRLEWIWPMYLDSFFANPILGEGVGYAKFTGAASHNDIIETLGEQGLIGAIFYIIMCWTFFREASHNQYTWLKLTSVILVLFMIASGFTHNTLSLKSFGLAVGLLAGQVNLGLCPTKKSPDNRPDYHEQSLL